MRLARADAPPRVERTWDFSAMLHALARPGVLPADSAGHESIRVVQTHASAVLLAGDRAYKLKKPRNLGFLDYSTPDLRREFCGREVTLNAHRAPSVYLGVAPIIVHPDGLLRLGDPLEPDASPHPGARYAGGTVIDYAVVMRRLPEEATLAARLAAGSAEPAMLAAVGRRIAAFHAGAATDARIAAFGSPETIGANWDENFRQMAPYVGRVLTAATYERITGYVADFLAARPALFRGRMEGGRVRDCHGDLRLEHVYILGTQLDRRDAVAIVDCIEFNERFRYGDVAAEVAFPVMELDAAGRPDLARTFVAAYIGATGDEDLLELLPFYCCYRACVRGKVAAFQLDEIEVPSPQREAAGRQAGALFSVAERYAGWPTHPCLVLVGGLMGTGKSTLAAALHSALGWPVYSSDVTRKRLARLDPAAPRPAPFGQGLYSREWTVRTYAALLQEAARQLGAGRSVLLDATFSRRADRVTVGRLAAAQHADAVFLECVCPCATALERLARRWAARLGDVGTHDVAGNALSLASDGRPELFAAQAAAWEPYDALLEPELRHDVVLTDVPLTVSVEHAREALALPRQARWLSPDGDEADGCSSRC